MKVVFTDFADVCQKNVYNQNGIHPDYIEILQSCMITSLVISSKDPKSALESKEFNGLVHNIQSLVVGEIKENDVDLQVKYMISCDHDKKIIIVTFHGNKLMNDFLIDVKLNGVLNDCQGRFHSGIFRRSEKIPINYFIQKLLNEGYKVIFTGSSMGAAVAALVAVRVLMHNSIYTNKEIHKNVLYIGFGSPAIADKHFKTHIENHFKNNFHFYKNENDIVVDYLTILSSVIYNNEELQNENSFMKSTTSLMDIIGENLTGGEIIQIPGIVSNIKGLFETVSRSIAKVFIPKYEHFGYIFQLKSSIEIESDFKESDNKEKLKTFFEKPDRFIDSLQNNYMGNYFKKLYDILTKDKLISRYVGEPRRITDFEDLYLHDYKYSTRLVINYSEIDIFLTVNSKIAEYIVHATIDIQLGDPIEAQITCESEDTVTLLFSVPKRLESLIFRNGLDQTNTLKCQLITHFQKAKIEIKIDESSVIKNGFRLKDRNIQNMSVDLLYLYAISYIINFQTVQDEELSTRCKVLKNSLKELDNLWKTEYKTLSEISDEELRGVLYSYFTEDFLSIDILKQKFEPNLVKLEDCTNKTDLKVVLCDALPTCYYLKNKLSSKNFWEQMKSFFLSIHNAIKRKNFKFSYREPSDKGYITTLKKYLKPEIIAQCLPYAGCYEKQVYASNRNQREDDKNDKILQTILINFEIRQILLKEKMIGTIGKKKCGKSTFIEKMIPNAQANSSTVEATTKMAPYRINEDFVLIDYPHFDSPDFSHKLQFIFSRYLLNQVILIFNAMEKMESDDTMKLFYLVKKSHENNFVILLNKADDVWRDCDIESEPYFGKSKLAKFKNDVIEHIGFPNSDAKNRLLLTCLKESDDLEELNLLSTVGILTSDSLRREILKINNIIVEIGEMKNSKKIEIQKENCNVTMRFMLERNQEGSSVDQKCIESFEALCKAIEFYKIKNPKFCSKYDNSVIIEDFDGFFKTDEIVFLVS